MALLLGVVSLALFRPARADARVEPQSLDARPAYHPEGPLAGFAEIYAGEPVAIEAALPGYTHAQSLAHASEYASMLCASGASLPFGVPLAPGALLWLDPSKLLVAKLLGPSLEHSIAGIPLAPGVSSAAVPWQLFCLRLSDGKLSTSPLWRLDVLASQQLGHTDQMRPVGALAAGGNTVSFDGAQNAYHLRWNGAGASLDYSLDLDEPSVAKGNLLIREATSGLVVAQDAGAWYRLGASVLPPGAFWTVGTHTLLAHGITNQTAWFEWQDSMPKTGGGTIVHRRRHELSIAGRSLKLRVRSLDPAGPAVDNYSAYSPGVWTSGTTALASAAPKHVAYMDQIGILLVNGQWFASTFVDLFQSAATRHNAAAFSQLPTAPPAPPGLFASYAELMWYEAASDGKVTPLDETSWITLAPTVEPCFVESSAAPSPYASKLARKVGVTLAETPFAGAYANDLAKVQQLVSFGFDDVHLFKQHWMRYGTNRRSTSHAPPHPGGGSEAQFKAFITAARAQPQWNVAVYTDMYSLDHAQGHDDNPNYSENPAHYENFEDGLKAADLSYREGFNLAQDLGVPTTPYYYTRILAPKRAWKHWQREADAFVTSYGANAAYFDINCISSPDLIVTGEGLNVGGAISLDARSPSDGTIRGAIRSYKGLYRGADVRSGGPSVGEGSFVGYESRFDTFYTGYLDGTYRTLSTGGSPYQQATSGQVQPVIVDYEVNHVRGRHWGIGLGQYTRFFYQGAPGSNYPLADAAIDEYRATEISYLHNGYFLTNGLTTDGGEYLRIAQQVKEYYVLRALQEQWEVAGAATVRYRTATSGSSWIDLSTGLKTGFNFAQCLLRITFANGLVQHVNHGTQAVQESGYWIPPNGWAITHPTNGFQALSVRPTQNGARYDLVKCTQWVLADGNGTAFNAGAPIGTTTNLKVVRLDTGKVLTENPDGTITVQ
ncbi:MAG: hypothetical protein EPO68_11520 [Planctomycetota bacterium]|nr:MAG: hypothetical protein EPO68_11520 [Planctomycetota bacterium]